MFSLASMNVLGFIQSVGDSAVGYVLPFLFVLTIVVFFHELGHFLVARWCNVQVEVFSIGFGREVFGWDDSKGTRWKISWVPLGGYVKFLGDDSAASNPDQDKLAKMDPGDRAKSFFHKPVGQRSAIAAAGPIANFILAIIIFAFIFMIFGRQVMTARVDTIQPDSAAVAAGFEIGDTVLAIDGEAIDSFSDMQRIVSASPGRELEILVERGGTEKVLLATPNLREIEDRFGNTHKLGLLGISRDATPEEVQTIRYNPISALWMGVKQTYFIIDRTLGYLWQVIIGVQDADQLGGPLRIAQVSGQMASVSFLALINLAAILSVSIGLINLFPIPLLDGGHLLFYGIEAARGRPLGEQTQEFGYRIGLALVMMLMVFATWNDLVQLRVFEYLFGLFS